MKVTITPSTARGTVKAPASKSMAHRSLICAALSGYSTVHGIEYSEDVKATLRCLSAMGCRFETDGDTVRFLGFDTNGAHDILDCGESGSTLRFMIPICLSLSGRYTLKGAGRLMQRPLGVYEDICEEQGLFFRKDAETVSVEGPLRSGTFTVPGDISSQFISGLLFSLPLLEGDSEIRITGNIESNSYIELTLQMLRRFGIKAFRDEPSVISVPGSQHYAVMETQVEGDYSNAAFFEALSCIGGDVTVTGLDEESLQGDRVYKKMLPLLTESTPVLDLSDCPDLAPILFTVAAMNNGAEFTGTARLKIKESDRAEVMKEELGKFGCALTVEEDSVIVPAGPMNTPTEMLDGHNDHRIVMSMAVACTRTGGTINGAQAVSKSLPDFFELLGSLGIIINKEQD